MLNEYPDVLNPRQVAQILGVGMNSAYDLLHNNEIHSKRIGRKYLVPKICVIDYLESARYNDSNMVGNPTVGKDDDIQ